MDSSPSRGLRSVARSLLHRAVSAPPLRGLSFLKRMSNSTTPSSQSTAAGVPETSIAGHFATDPSITGPSDTGPSLTGPSLTGPTENGHSITGFSATASSIAGSDGSDTAAESTSTEEADFGLLKEASDLAGEITNLEIVPWSGGANYTQSTELDDFEDWIDYLTFCNDGPKIRIFCVDPYADEFKNVTYNVLEVSKKFWADLSPYFKGLVAHGWMETAGPQVYVRFDDITKQDLVFLQQFLLAGPMPAERPRIGTESKALRRLARAHELADRFLIHAIKPLLVLMAKEVVLKDASWRCTYAREVEIPGTLNTLAAEAAREFHEDKLVDYSEAFDTCHRLPGYARVINPEELVMRVLNHAPHMLVARMCKDPKDADRIPASQDFKDHVFYHMTVLKNA